MIQQKIHRGVFAVMDGTFAGDGPGPRCMVPHVKNVLLASADQVAIDAVAAKLMGMDPLSIRFIRLAHDLGLGCGDPRDIEIVGDTEAASENWHFAGPFKKMTFASRMQHQIYWGPLKKPLEWSLKTVLAPWSYMASVVYHDSFWYPVKGKRMMQAALDSEWGRLFRNWETLSPDENGFPTVGDQGPELEEDFLIVVGRAQRGALHLEARYNYEDRKTGSLFAEWTFSTEAFTASLTPMAGVAFGQTSGFIPALEAELGYLIADLYAETEYLVDFNEKSDSFFYSWLELGFSPAELLRLGLVAQRTRLFQTPLVLDRGLFVQLIPRFGSVSVYGFNLFTESWLFVLGLQVEWSRPVP